MYIPYSGQQKADYISGMENYGGILSMSGKNKVNNLKTISIL
jgi:hypothetical protein